MPLRRDRLSLIAVAGDREQPHQMHTRSIRHPKPAIPFFEKLAHIEKREISDQQARRADMRIH